jgi:hypothetical protein
MVHFLVFALRTLLFYFHQRPQRPQRPGRPAPAAAPGRAVRACPCGPPLCKAGLPFAIHGKSYILCTGGVSYAPFILLLISNLSYKGRWRRRGEGRALLPSPSLPCRDEVNSLCPAGFLLLKYRFKAIYCC